MCDFDGGRGTEDSIVGGEDNAFKWQCRLIFESEFFFLQSLPCHLADTVAQSVILQIRRSPP